MEFLARELVRTADQLVVKHVVRDSFRMLSTQLRTDILIPIMKAFVKVETKNLEKIYIFVEEKKLLRKMAEFFLT